MLLTPPCRCLMPIFDYAAATSLMPIRLRRCHAEICHAFTPRRRCRCRRLLPLPLMVTLDYAITPPLRHADAVTPRYAMPMLPRCHDAFDDYLRVIIDATAYFDAADFYFALMTLLMMPRLIDSAPHCCYAIRCHDGHIHSAQRAAAMLDATPSHAIETF